MFAPALAADASQAGARVRRLRWLMLWLAMAALAGCALERVALPWLLVGQALATLAAVNLLS